MPSTNASDVPPPAIHVPISLLLTGFALLGLVVAAGRLSTASGCESHHEVASVTVKNYAFDAFPAWKQAHPGPAYPTGLDELSPYMNDKDAVDPWGSPYFMAPGTKGILVWSLGEDGKDGTADDIRSDD